MQDALEKILADNANAKTLAQLIPLLIRLVALYQADVVNFPPAGDFARLDWRYWSPQFIRGRARPATHSRPFWGMQLATLLGRTQDKGGGKRKLDRNMSAAMRLLEYYEVHSIPVETFYRLAENLSQRAQLELARKISKNRL